MRSMRAMQVTRRRQRVRRTMIGCAMAIVLAVNGKMLMAAGDGRIDINTASVSELIELPGVGPAKAAAIVEERERKPFASVEDITRVSGIGDRMLEQLRDKISVGGADGNGGAGNRSGAGGGGGTDGAGTKSGAKSR